MKLNRFSLRGKAALITGGAGILGSAISSGIAQAGADVAIAEIDFSKAKALSKKIERTYNVKSCAIECDVSDPGSVKHMMAEAVKKLKRIDILFNNAASKASNIKAFFAPFEKYSLDTWREVTSVNIDGMFLVAQAAGNQMIRQGRGGVIIQTGSIYGIVAPDQRTYKDSSYLGVKINSPAVYSASKGAVIALSKYLAAYWADKKIRVNTLIPGGIESGQNSIFKKKYSDRVPMKRMAKTDDMVGAAIYLASDASKYATGLSLLIDGGLSIW